jgi:hypothetical protein
VQLEELDALEQVGVGLDGASQSADLRDRACFAPPLPS